MDSWQSRIKKKEEGHRRVYGGSMEESTLGTGGLRDRGNPMKPKETPYYKL